MSRVVYCNAILTGSSRYMYITDKLQRLLNAAAARLVTATWKFDHGLSLLLHDELYWLHYKLGVAVHRYLHDKAPKYLVDCCSLKHIAAALCALDPPTVSASMYQKLPGAPGAVRCGMTCTSDVGCKHFNYVSTESNPCQPYHYRPTNFGVSPNCQHYYQPGLQNNICYIYIMKIQKFTQGLY